MVYLVPCILPKGKICISEKIALDNCSTQISTLDLEYEDLEENENSLISVEMQSYSIRVRMKGNDIFHDVSLQNLSSYFSFIYSSRLIFMHERDYRSIPLLLYDSNEYPNALTLGLSQSLDRGEICNDISIRHVSEAIGYGLFSDDAIPIGTFLGEYCGIVKRNSSTMDQKKSNYAHMYPSCDCEFEIDASEYGNVIRFINHSTTPNAQFSFVLHEAIVHVICVSILNIFLKTIQL
jgi:hypothetical protein